MLSTVVVESSRRDNPFPRQTRRVLSPASPSLSTSRSATATIRFAGEQRVRGDRGMSTRYWNGPTGVHPGDIEHRQAPQPLSAVGDAELLAHNILPCAKSAVSNRGIRARATLQVPPHPRLTHH